MNGGAFPFMLLSELLVFFVGLLVGYITGIAVKRAERADFIEPAVIAKGNIETFTSTSTTQFIDSVSPKEKFNNANNVSDLLQ